MRGSAKAVRRPNKVVIGWLEPGATRKDANEYARAWASRHFDAPSLSWYAVMPFLGGWLYEVQEGGGGASYLPAVTKALASGVEQSSIRVGTRALSVTMRDGRPFFVLLSSHDSKVLLENEDIILSPGGRMRPVVREGTGVLVSGSAFLVCGFLFLGGSAAFYQVTREFVPSDRAINVDLLPHNQWDRVGDVPPNLYVERLELEAGSDRWQTTVKPIQRSPDTPEAANTLAAEDPILEDETVEEDLGVVGGESVPPTLETGE